MVVENIIFLTKSDATNFQQVGQSCDSVFRLINKIEYQTAWIFTSGLGTFIGIKNSDHICYSAEKALLNFFAFKKNHKNDIEVIVAKVHIEPFAGYSLKHKRLSDLPNGAKIAIPNDPSNSGRALLLLAHQGLIKLKDGTKISATKKDIISNPKHLDIRELEAAMLPRVLNQVDLALINTNYALAAKLNPLKDALFIEDQRSPYANVLVARIDNHNSPVIKKLIAALTSPETKKFIQEKYKGAVIPAF